MSTLCSDSSALAALLAALAPGGTLAVTVRAADAGAPLDAARAVVGDLLLTGFRDVTFEAQGDASVLVRAAKAPEGAAPLGGARIVRRAAAAGAAAAAAAPAAPAGVTFVPAPGAAAWAAAASAPAGGLIDEGALLDGDDVTVGAGAAAGGGCAPKRKACKNCSCGRKEQEEAADNAAVLLNTGEGGAAEASAPSSSCGSCWKGDAFRCASCPHLGKPAFKAGSDGAVLLDMGAADF
jgi:anamorsin